MSMMSCEGNDLELTGESDSLHVTTRSETHAVFVFLHAITDLYRRSSSRQVKE